MSFVLWDPFLPRDFLDAPFATKRKSYVSDSEKEILLEVDAPGMKIEDITVSVDRGSLLIEGKSERRNRSFSKSYTLPENIDEEGISAKLVDGILAVTIPKREAPGARKIPVLGA